MFKNQKELRMNKDRKFDFSPSPSYPTNMLMEICDVCNHNCVFCGYHDQKRKKQFADKDLMFNIMDEAYELGTREIGFYMIGEPFLNPELPLYVEHAKKTGYEYIYITTNGALAEKDKVRDLLEKGLNSIKISCNAATREIYLKIHRKDDFDKVANNIRMISKLKSEFDFSFFISFVKCNWNENEVPIIYNMFSKYVDNIYIYNCAATISDWNCMELVQNGIVDKLKGFDYPCIDLFNRFSVTAQGYLTCCCNDFNNDLVIADLSLMSLKDAWNSKIYTDFRKRHIEGVDALKGSICYSCLTAKISDYKPLNTMYNNL